MGFKRGNNIGNMEIIFNVIFPEDYTSDIKKKLEELI